MASVFGDLSDKFRIVEHGKLGRHDNVLKAEIADYLACNLQGIAPKLRDLLKAHDNRLKKMGQMQRGTLVTFEIEQDPATFEITIWAFAGGKKYKKMSLLKLDTPSV